MIKKVISGGQTGVDRAALMAAMTLGIPHGGYCPLGRRAEDGIIPDVFQMTETETPDYDHRTLKNVQTADGTLVLHRGPMSGGTWNTATYCRRHEKPLMVIDLDEKPGPVQKKLFHSWVKDHSIHTLNIAGPRESKSLGIYAVTLALLKNWLVFEKRKKK